MILINNLYFRYTNLEFLDLFLKFIEVFCPDHCPHLFPHHVKGCAGGFP